MTFAQTLSLLIERQNLSFEQMRELMQQIMGGQLTPAQIAATLVALRVKGETVEEIAAAAAVMRALSSKVAVAHSQHLVDTCGTGGDGIQTFNVSTASALVASAAGVVIAKHGGRSVSSTCGSADVLEKLGVNVNLTADKVAYCVDNIGIGFMFAPNHHSAMKHAAPVRRELGVRTLFNLLGPLTNPAGALNQVLGVFHPSLTGKLAQVLAELGSQHVLVVHGADGMDEITISAPTYVAELHQGKVSEYQLTPEQFGLNRASLESLRVSNADEAAQMLMSVLDNQPGAACDIVVLNAGAAIYVSGLASSLQQGVERARQTIGAGAAKNKLNQLIDLSKRLAE